MNANISNEVRRGIYRRDGFRCACAIPRTAYRFTTSYRVAWAAAIPR